VNKYMLRISSEVVDSPVIAAVVLETKVLVNILRAKVDYDEGTMVVSVLGTPEEQKKVVDALKRRGVEVAKLERNITNDVSKCVNCGACVSLCPTSALSLSEDNTLKVESDKCIRCGACVAACPLRSLTIQMI
jgi:ferredoxin